MKFTLSMSALACMTLTACSWSEVKEVNENAILQGVNSGDEHIVSLGLGGEVTISRVAMSRAENTDLCGIQVYSQSLHDETASMTCYAYGLFDDVSKASIKLIDGYRYRFVATVVIDGKNTLYHAGAGYASPFGNSSSAKYTLPYNAFNYSSTDYFNGLGMGYSYLKDEEAYFWRPCTDRYYGVVEDCIPQGQESITIDMVRTSFGLRVKAEELTEGSIKVSLNYAKDLTLTYPDTEAECIYTFYHVALAYSKGDDYSETITTSVTWTRADGVDVPIGTYDIEFPRNKMTILDIKVADTETTSAMTPNYGDEEMTEGETQIIEIIPPVEDDSDDDLDDAPQFS